MSVPETGNAGTVPQQAMIRALGRIAEVRHDIRALADAVSRIPLWRPSAGLAEECRQALRIMDDLEARFDRQLVVTIIGPCGSGKSTLLNALSGVDDLSATGIDRPTTRNVVVFARKPRDADFFVDQFGPDKVTIRTSPAAAHLDHVLLVDTPDTDSLAQQAHIPMVEQAVALSDILLCVFNGENPKTRDHVDFFAPYVHRFDGESLVGVLNRCDRLDADELRQRILPEFNEYIRSAWEKPVHRIFCVSARGNLKHPDWAAGAEPRHGVDEFDALRRMIFGAFNQGGFVVDRRVDNAHSLRDLVGLEAIGQVEPVRERLAGVMDRIGEAENEGLAEAAGALNARGPQPASGVHTLVYQKLAGRWVGPVGWLVAAWARLLALAAGFTTALRFGRPFQRFKGATQKEKDRGQLAVPSALPSGETLSDTARRHYRTRVLQHWPDIAESLVQCRFDPAVREIDHALPDGGRLDEELSAIWRQSLDEAVETAVARLSSGALQLLFNLPAFGILAHVGWTTAREYFAGNYLPANYFLHAAITVGIALFLSFFVFQACVRVWGGVDRIATDAVQTARIQAARLQPLTRSPVARQVEAILGLVPAVAPPRRPAEDPGDRKQAGLPGPDNAIEDKRNDTQMV